MSKTGWVLIGAGVLVVVLMLVAFFWTMNVRKGEIVLQNSYAAQTNVVETTLDGMRKTLINQFKIKKAFAEDFIKVAMAQSAGRKGGALFKSSTEAANKLGIGPEIYMKMLNSIEGQIAGFKRAQDTLTDKWREHTTYCKDPYHNMLWVSLASKALPKPEMISSGVTKEAIKTKELDDDLLGS